MQDDQPLFPAIPKLLLFKLNEKYPERSPILSDLENGALKAAYSAGQRDVIRFLNHIYYLQHGVKIEHESRKM